jgi:transglutaminase-like putative cysteine protease
MNYDIRYLTSYRYAAPVTDNLNALRVRPATTSNQRCDEFHIRVDPEARTTRHADYFGTEVVELGVARPHDRLTIDVRARVVTNDPPEPPEAPWEHLQGDTYAEAAGEFLQGGDDDHPEPADESLADLLAIARARTPLATVRWLDELIPDRFAYRPGVTYVGSTVDDLLRAGAGVCQDFVHLALVLLRRNGIAARYVSGYLFSAPEDGGTDSVEVQTHAWLEALLPGTGGRGEPIWVGADPTNRRLAGETHVKIGHGRRYADVPPIKGVYRGAAGAELDASVTMTRLDPAASARA